MFINPLISQKKFITKANVQDYISTVHHFPDTSKYHKCKYQIDVIEYNLRPWFLQRFSMVPRHPYYTKEIL